MTTHIEYDDSPTQFFSNYIRIECVRCIQGAEANKKRIQEQTKNYDKQIENVTQKLKKCDLKIKSRLETQLQSLKTQKERHLNTKRPSSLFEEKIPIWGVNAAALSFHTSHEGHPIKIWYGDQEYTTTRGEKGKGWNIASPGYQEF